MRKKLRLFQRLISVRGTLFQLGQQMPPLIFKLSLTDGNSFNPYWFANLPDIESIAPGYRLLMHMPEIEIDRFECLRVGTKPFQLRVLLVAFGSSSQNRLGQEAFTPNGQKSVAVQVFRM